MFASLESLRRRRSTRTSCRKSERGRVALYPGLRFGAPGRGCARLDIGSAEELLAEAVARMASAVG
jgi:bifunctional pyridoxal-dependent enzyme with beta-cystathionase and maltose regulon repressor activities